MSLFRQFLLALLLAGTGGAAWLLLDPPADAEDAPVASPRAAAVVVAPVGFVPEQVQVEAVGTARAQRSASLHPAAAGLVQAVSFSADAAVEEGDVLVELDRAAEELAVDLAKVRLADAERVFGRLQRLSATGATAQATFDDARTALEAARIELKRAEVALEDRFVLAPFAGRIGLTDIDVGDRIGPDTEIATLDDRSSLLVRFEVPEALHGRLGTGAEVEVSAWSEPQQPVSGTVVDVGSRVSERTRSFVAQARIPNPGDRLRPGMSFRVRARVDGQVHPEVPEAAIQWGGDGSYLWALEGGAAGAGETVPVAARRVPVVIVQRQGGRVLVDGRLDPGDVVVVEGLHRMREGMMAEIIPAAPEQAAPLPARLRGAGS